LLILAQGFDATEYQSTQRPLRNAGYTIVVAGPSEEQVSTLMANADWLHVQPDVTLEDVQVEDYDGVVFIGGDGATVHYASHPEAHRVAQEALAQGKVIAAICIAPVILANAGVLEGKTATVWDPPSTCHILEQGGATCVDELVHRDGLVVTAREPASSRSFARAILEAIRER
jgi:protease I